MTSQAEELLHSTTIDRALASGAKLLRGLAINPRARSILADVGYTDEEHARGWNNYVTLMGSERPVSTAVIAPDAKAAVDQIDSADESLFKLTRFSLQTRYPEQCSKLFDGLRAQTGYSAVIGMETFLTRIQALREGSPTDQAAAELLRRRKLLSEERENELLRAIQVAKGLNVPAAPRLTEDAGYQQAAREFVEWVREWRGIASIVITRRDDRIMLGLAKRRTHKSVQAPTEPIEPELDDDLDAD
jgi:hypothetical protein